jgi:hypothetical protein
VADGRPRAPGSDQRLQRCDLDVRAAAGAVVGEPGQGRTKASAPARMRMGVERVLEVRDRAGCLAQRCGDELTETGRGSPRREVEQGPCRTGHQQPVDLRAVDRGERARAAGPQQRPTGCGCPDAVPDEHLDRSGVPVGEAVQLRRAPSGDEGSVAGHGERRRSGGRTAERCTVDPEDAGREPVEPTPPDGAVDGAGRPPCVEQTPTGHDARAGRRQVVEPAWFGRAIGLVGFLGRMPTGCRADQTP